MASQISNNRTIIITGANKGIGYTIIETLLSESTPYTIILTARNPVLGNQAVEDLQAKYKNATSKVIFRQLDVTDDKSVDEFVGWVKSSYGKIDALVNNAGLGGLDKPTLEKQLGIIQTNIISLIDLTEKLLPYLAIDGKIINISSGFGILNLQRTAIRDLLNDEHLSEKTLLYLANSLYEATKESKQQLLGFSEDVYLASKALVNAYTRWILPRKLKGDQQAFTVCPGWCATDMGGKEAHRTVEQGAATPVYLLNLPWKNDERLNGQFFRDDKVIDYTKDVYGLKETFGIDEGPVN